MTNQNICCDSALASSVLADAESYFWIDVLQGESVAESGSVISHYFRTYFSLYVVPRGLTFIAFYQRWESSGFRRNSCFLMFPRGQSQDLSKFVEKSSMYICTL